jgi:ParB-like chromosome segregation protein Spo0J
MNLFEEINTNKIQVIDMGYIPVATIFPPEDGLKPSRDFVASVKLYGQIIDSLLLISAGKTICPDASHAMRWRIVSGTRRYLAAIECGLSTVPAKELRAVDGAEYALTIASNRHRSDNLIADLKSAAALIAGGCEYADIRKLTGLTKAEIDRLRGIAAGDKRIIKALAAGLCVPSVAEAAAKLPPKRQVALMDEFSNRLTADPKSRLTGKDVAKIKTAMQSSTVSQLPDSLFEDAPIPRPEPSELQQTVARLLEFYGEQAVLETIHALKHKTERRTA